MSEPQAAQPEFKVLTEPKQILEVFRLGLEVIVQKESGSEKRPATIVGWSPKRYVIIEGLSTSVFSGGALFQGNSLLIRFQHLGGVFGFAAQVQAVLRDPSLIVVAWPAKVERVDLTSEKRVPLELEVILQVGGSGGKAPSNQAVLRDLSTGGCQLVVTAGKENQEAFPPGQEIVFSFARSDKGQGVEMSGKVANARAAAGGLVLGVHFSEGQEDKLAKLWSLAFPPPA